MKKDVLFATGNSNKIREAEPFFEKLSWKLITPQDVGIDEFPHESAKTFVGNSLIKALYGAEKSGLITVGEDSGICVKALGNMPGVNSKRWAEEQGKDFLKILYSKVSGKDPSAFIISVLSVISPDGLRLRLCSGKVLGKLVEPSGKSGFGYDPMFMPNGATQTFGEMSRREKGELSHRAIAFRNLIRHSRLR